MGMGVIAADGATLGKVVIGKMVIGGDTLKVTTGKVTMGKVAMAEATMAKATPATPKEPSNGVLSGETISTSDFDSDFLSGNSISLNH